MDNPPHQRFSQSALIIGKDVFLVVGFGAADCLSPRD